MAINKLTTSIFCGLMTVFAAPANAIVFDLPSNGDNVVGHIKYDYAQSGETLFDVGRRHDIGYFEMVEANPRVSSEGRLSTHSKLVIPSRFILPPSKHEGIVINLAELRLYYYLPGQNKVLTEPVGIGRVGWITPLGTTKIVEKVKDPSWHPTDAVREDAAAKGYILPDVWPPGADNPLGAYMMRLGWHSYLIHGTSHPEGVGKRVSAGCIRMFPEDIERLFQIVKVGTPVRVMSNPIKIGWQGEQFYLEAHKPLEERGDLVEDDTINMVERVSSAVQNRPVAIHWSAAHEEVKRQSGIPVVIGTIRKMASSAQHDGDHT